MTDLVKTFTKVSTAKAIVTKRGEGHVVVKGHLAAVIDKPKFRAAPIRMPVFEGTSRDQIFAMCNHLVAQGMSYKELRREVIAYGDKMGWPNAGTEVSRWRHRFN